ncbi:short-subunit dehydrogenase [Agrobacterium vitis]|nr:short-subunit dehydrogenase [Agrobacterium vitis]MBE1439605.1 short-subunit dehydrogenase [Agrobacterium vitis]
MQNVTHTQTSKTFTGKSNAGTARRALITGASSGMGLEYADLLAAQKINLVLAARRREPMEKLAAELRQKYGVEVVVETTDLSVPGAAAQLKSNLDDKSLQIDILVNNAGYGLHGDFLDTPLENTTDMIQLNITAVTELSFIFGQDMAARGDGQILLIASILSFQPVPGFAAYAATKSYVLSFGEALHNELRPRGVTVTCLCPGHTETGFDAAASAPVSPVLRFLTMKPRPVAETGLRALAKGKASVLPGFLNNIIIFSNRLTPRSMQRAVMKNVTGG